MFEMKKAERRNAHLIVGVWGPSGSGKTYSSLHLGKGLVGEWEKIAVLDTENSSSELYSHLGAFNHIDFPAPFSPKRYIEAIRYCEGQPGIECLIIDSISHEWEGLGGCLDIHAQYGGKFQDWARVTPMHQSFIQAVVQSKLHIIVTGRTKVDYALNRDDKSARNKVEKMGMKTVTREGFDYEMTVAFKINQEHLAEIDKDRTGIFADAIPFKISEETGALLREWNKTGVEKVESRNDLMEELRSIVRNIPEAEMDAFYKDIGVDDNPALIREFTREQLKEAIRFASKYA